MVRFGAAADRARLGRRCGSAAPLGLAVVGGLLVSQTLTLYVTPVFYVYMEKLRRHKPTPNAPSSLEELDQLPEPVEAV
jgi:hydrophobic/amphiphilic exporter-1 (mainly G- bacteria), HAE1 family